jgi:hypothetical protein
MVQLALNCCYSRLVVEHKHHFDAPECSRRIILFQNHGLFASIVSLSGAFGVLLMVDLIVLLAKKFRDENFFVGPAA